MKPLTKGYYMTKAKTAKVAEVTTEATAEPLHVVSRDSLYTTLKAIDTALEAVIVAGNTVQQEYQRIACSSILHLATHKDIRVIRKLLETLPEGMRKKSMATFIDKFAPVTFDEEGQVFYNKDKKLRLGEALAMPWWKAAKEAVYIPFVFTAEVEKLLMRAAKRLDKADADKGDQITAEQLNALAELMASFKVANTAKKAA